MGACFNEEVRFRHDTRLKVFLTVYDNVYGNISLDPFSISILFKLQILTECAKTEGTVCAGVETDGI